MTPRIALPRPFPLLAAALLSACAPSSPPETEPSPVASSGTVTSQQINQSPNESVEEQIMKRSPGVRVARNSDGAITVRIRGGSSLMGNNEPLYMVDGSPFSPGPNGALTGLNPHDIDTIKVLKDPAELTMYGVRGANGVIVIRTKQGQKR